MTTGNLLIAIFGYRVVVTGVLDLGLDKQQISQPVEARLAEVTAALAARGFSRSSKQCYVDPRRFRAR